MHPDCNAQVRTSEKAATIVPNAQQMKRAVNEIQPCNHAIGSSNDPSENTHNASRIANVRFRR